MAARIRLARGGSKKNAMYRIVVADSRMARDGRFLEKLGTYNPHTKQVMVDVEATQKWINNGAAPTQTVHKLLLKQGLQLPALVFAEKKKKAEAPAES